MAKDKSSSWGPEKRQMVLDAIELLLSGMCGEYRNDCIENIESFIIFTPEKRLLWIRDEFQDGSRIPIGLATGDASKEDFKEDIAWLKPGLHELDNKAKKSEFKHLGNFTEISDLTDMLLNLFNTGYGMTPFECRRSCRSAKKIDSQDCHITKNGKDYEPVDDGALFAGGIKAPAHINED